MGELCRDLLTEWCESLYRLQIRGTGNPRLDGGILCPACGKIHGRCGDAMYPFLCMAGQERDERWIRAAKAVHSWTKNVVWQGDGSLINDIDSEWRGITVFYAVQLSDCIRFHSDLLDPETKDEWMDELGQIGDFLYGMESLEKNNINYPLTNALALALCGQILKRPMYLERARRLAALAVEVMTENGLLYGEGVPRSRITPRGCRSVDIGYNVEETLPSLYLYASEFGDESLVGTAERYLKAHLEFMTDDGGWDNSFGTRNFKWTYWGSRTSDGCALGYLLAGKDNPELAEAARRNLELLRECTGGGLLMGGPHYEAAGQPPCVHHTFTHAKVLAGILDRGLQDSGLQDSRIQGHGIQGRGLRDCGLLPSAGGFSSVGDWTSAETDLNGPLLAEAGVSPTGTSLNGSPLAEAGACPAEMKWYPELSTWTVRRGGLRATVTAYDWEYVPGGHVSGGTLSLLRHRKAGTVFCAGVGSYTLRERNNMQVPYRVTHECLALRIEALDEGEPFSSIYEDRAQLVRKDNRILVRGCLKNIRHEPLKNGEYRLEYLFGESEITVRAYFSAGCLVCPVVSRADERVCVLADQNRIEFGSPVRVWMDISGKMVLPYGEERIFNLVPGFQALRVDAGAYEGTAELRLRFSPEG